MNIIKVKRSLSHIEILNRFDRFIEFYKTKNQTEDKIQKPKRNTDSSLGIINTNTDLNKRTIQIDYTPTTPIDWQTKAKDFGIFSIEDIAYKILYENLKKDKKALINFLSINSTFRRCIGLFLHVFLRGSELEQSSSKVKFIRANNFNLAIGLKDLLELREMIQFLKNPYNENLTNNLECLSLNFDMSIKSDFVSEDIQELMELLKQRCKNLKTLICKNIEAWSCEIILPSSLITFCCMDIYYTTLILPEKLQYFTCGNFITVNSRYVLNMPSSLKSCTFAKLFGTVNFPENSELSHFFCKSIAFLSKLKFPGLMSNLTSFYCENIAQKANIILPQIVPQLAKCEFGAINNQRTKTEFENFKSKTLLTEKI